MKTTGLFFLCTLLFALIGSATPRPELNPPALEDYDLQSLKDDFDDHPVVTNVRSDVLQSLAVKNDTQETAGSSEAEKKIMEKLSDMDVLLNLLEIDLQYLKKRQEEDPSWPKSLANKVGSGLATKWEEIMFHEDLHHTISGIVIMKILEERVSAISKYANGKLLDSPNAFAGSDSAELDENLVGLQFLEIFLHTVNQMVDAAVTINPELPSSLQRPTDFEYPITPLPMNEDMDMGEEVGAFIFLFFSVIGFFFAIFIVIFACYKTTKKCFLVASTHNKKSKYEQI